MYSFWAPLDVFRTLHNRISSIFIYNPRWNLKFIKLLDEFQTLLRSNYQVSYRIFSYVKGFDVFKKCFFMNILIFRLFTDFQKRRFYRLLAGGHTDYWPGTYRLFWGPREVSDYSQGSLRLFRADYFQLSPRLNMTIMMNVAGDDENDYGNDDDKHRC